MCKDMITPTLTLLYRITSPCVYALLSQGMMRSYLHLGTVGREGRDGIVCLCFSGEFVKTAALAVREDLSITGFSGL